MYFKQQRLDVITIVLVVVLVVAKEVVRHIAKMTAKTHVNGVVVDNATIHVKEELLLIMDGDSIYLM